MRSMADYPKISVSNITTCKSSLNMEMQFIFATLDAKCTTFHPILSIGVWVWVRLIENSLMVFFVSFARLANRWMKRMCNDVNQCLLLHPYTLLQLGSITNDKSRECQRLNNEWGREGNWVKKTRCNMFSSLSTCGEQRNKSHAFTSYCIPSYDHYEQFFSLFLFR